MKYLVLVIIILFSDCIYSQKTLDAVLLLKGSKDSLKVEIIVEMNRIDLNSINESSITKTVKIVNENDENWFKEDWIKAKKIDLLKFTDFEGRKRVFVTKNYAKELKKIDSVNYRLYEKLFSGKISWYRKHWTNMSNYRRMSRDYFIIEGQKKPISILFTTHKKQLLKLTKDRPDLASKINKLENYKSINDEDIIKILELYNKKN